MWFDRRYHKFGISGTGWVHGTLPKSGFVASKTDTNNFTAFRHASLTYVWIICFCNGTVSYYLPNKLATCLVFFFRPIKWCRPPPVHRTRRNPLPLPLPRFVLYITQTISMFLSRLIIYLMFNYIPLCLGGPIFFYSGLKILFILYNDLWFNILVKPSGQLSGLREPLINSGNYSLRAVIFPWVLLLLSNVCIIYY